ncbi:MAG: MFS transporter [Legionella sp.]|nr:MFS transporter [Legionella sp.]
MVHLSTSYQAHDTTPTIHRAVLIICLAAAFFFYKYILQNFPSVMASELMSSFHLQGLGLGVLSGAYFWAYLIVPLFVGIILDHYGVRWITTGAILCCAMGVFIFSRAEHLDSAVLGRTLMGVGVSFATLTYFKLASIWFDKKYYALLTSLLVTIGMLGAVCGQMPLAWLIHQSGWRSSLDNIGMAGIILALLFASCVKDKPNRIELQDRNNPASPGVLQGILLVLKSKQNWLLTGYGGLAFAPVIIFCGLWGNPFLQKAYNIDNLEASSLISLVFIGLAIGSPLFALWLNHLQNKCAIMFYCTVLSAMSLTLVIYAHPLPLWLLSGLLFSFGFSLGAFPMVFVIGKDLNPLYLAGTAASLINASDAFLDAVTEPMIGKILDYLSYGDYTQDFSLGSYHLALAILPLYQIIGAFLLKYIKES